MPDGDVMDLVGMLIDTGMYRARRALPLHVQREIFDRMGPDRLLSWCVVDCDGSACGSGPAVGRHTHQPQDGGEALARLRVTDHRVEIVEEADCG